MLTSYEECMKTCMRLYEQMEGQAVVDGTLSSWKDFDENQECQGSSRGDGQS